MFKKIRSILLMAGMATVLYTGSITGECHTLPESSFAQVEGTILKRGQGVSDAGVTNDIQALQKLPVSILNTMIANGIYIYEVDTINDVNGGSLSKGVVTDGMAMAPKYQFVMQNGQYVAQLVSPGYIDILSNKVTTWADSQSTLLHEIGHQLDHLYLGCVPATNTYCNASRQQEWQEIYAAEKNAIASYSKSAACNVYTACEAFAEATSVYFMDPAWLQKNCPLSYAYAEKVVSWF